MEVRTHHPLDSLHAHAAVKDRQIRDLMFWFGLVLAVLGGALVYLGSAWGALPLCVGVAGVFASMFHWGFRPVRATYSPRMHERLKQSDAKLRAAAARPVRLQSASENLQGRFYDRDKTMFQGKLLMNGGKRVQVTLQDLAEDPERAMMETGHVTGGIAAAIVDAENALRDMREDPGERAPDVIVDPAVGALDGIMPGNRSREHAQKLYNMYGAHPNAPHVAAFGHAMVSQSEQRALARDPMGPLRPQGAEHDFSREAAHALRRGAAWDALQGNELRDPRVEGYDGSAASRLPSESRYGFRFADKFNTDYEQPLFMPVRDREALLMRAALEVPVDLNAEMMDQMFMRGAEIPEPLESRHAWERDYALENPANRDVHLRPREGPSVAGGPPQRLPAWSSEAMLADDRATGLGYRAHRDQHRRKAHRSSHRSSRRSRSHE